MNTNTDKEPNFIWTSGFPFATLAEEKAKMSPSLTKQIVSRSWVVRSKTSHFVSALRKPYASTCFRYPLTHTRVFSSQLTTESFFHSTLRAAAEPFWLEV